MRSDLLSPESLADLSLEPLTDADTMGVQGGSDWWLWGIGLVVAPAVAAGAVVVGLTVGVAVAAGGIVIGTGCVIHQATQSRSGS